MEAIDDYANEHLARSLAYTVLELRQQHHFLALIPMASQALKQRIKYLQPTSQSDADEWNKIIQWQADGCPEQIEELWQTAAHDKSKEINEDVYQNPVYYKRFDADTLHVVIPFQQQQDQIYLVILVLEGEEKQKDDAEDSTMMTTQAEEEELELKYQNTKQVSYEEWQDIQATWSDSLEEAERLFILQVTRNAKHSRKESKAKREQQRSASPTNKDAPDDYWGDWSSDETEGDKEGKAKALLDEDDRHEREDDVDSEDEYYARWSQNPGTLTPGMDEGEGDDDLSSMTSQGRRLSMNHHHHHSSKPEVQEEWDEEYDQSYNPLFTVPSVPNLVDTHTTALQELTHMLQTSLPPSTTSAATTAASAAASIPGISMATIDPLPKAVQHRVEWDEEPLEQHVPGAYPASRGTKTPITPTSISAPSTSKLRPPPPPPPTANTAVSWDEQKRHAGKLLLRKSMHALVGAAKLLGLTSDDIGEMVKDILRETESQ